MTDSFEPVTLTKGDRSVTAHTPADLVQAKFDGFIPVKGDAQTVAKHEEKKTEEPAVVEETATVGDSDLGSTGSRTTSSSSFSGRTR